MMHRSTATDPKDPTASYSRIFPPASEDWDWGALEALATAMLSTDDELWPDRMDGPIPAGYTYLGQLLAHDLTYDSSEGLARHKVSRQQVLNRRAPGLNLRSIYGSGPDGTDSSLYCPDGIGMCESMIGQKGQTGPVLPRDPAGQAKITDPRNDETLTLAQMQAAFLTFHNRVADLLEKERRGLFGFDDVRKIVSQHFQSIVLHDYLWRVVPDRVFHDVIKHGTRLIRREDMGFVPLEFSHAAFRFGHSMVRGGYKWSSSIRRADLQSLFKRTGRNGDLAIEALSPDWLIEWQYFFDCSALEGALRHKSLNQARRINTTINLALASLPPGERAHDEPASLPVRDALRGAQINLISAQEAIRACNAKGVFMNCLLPEELLQIESDTVRHAMEHHGLHRKTPLWFYILAEAELRHNGTHLGELGGRIVMETVYASIATAEHSILSNASWKPSLGSVRGDYFSMPDMLRFSRLV